MELNAADLAMVQDVLPELRNMGFDLSLFGGPHHPSERHGLPRPPTRTRPRCWRNCWNN
ncbi:MAG: hypothetical protein R2818_03535 [Flavobacteriales bacterium]